MRVHSQPFRSRNRDNGRCVPSQQIPNSSAQSNKDKTLRHLEGSSAPKFTGVSTGSRTHLAGIHGCWREVRLNVYRFKAEKEEDTLAYRQAAQKVGSCATFIYTSGTTGPPKAVMISHDSYMWTCDAIGKVVEVDK
jgi:long-subunit acyl-CoA synthetase (AMP-forming)